MTPEELIKLCDEAERPPDYSMADGGPAKGRGRVSNEMVSREAITKLKEFGFVSSSLLIRDYNRVRSYAALQTTVSDLLEQMPPMQWLIEQGSLGRETAQKFAQVIGDAYVLLEALATEEKES